MTVSNLDDRWPLLELDQWRETRDTLHLWTQIAGKLKVELAPFQNQLWQTALTLTARGLTTGPLPAGDATLQADFDFIDHQFTLQTASGGWKSIPLYPRSVADFYGEVMGCLMALGTPVTIDTQPQEIAGDTTPLNEDSTHQSYDAAAAHRWWRIMLSSARVIEEHRQWFTGKTSSALFYWGSFDLSVARYNGSPCVPPARGGYLRRVSESETNWTAGFWPGSGEISYPAFYAYANPQPAGFEHATVQPQGTAWNADMGEYLLPYDDVRVAADPSAALRAFLQSTYEATADLGGWDRSALEITQIPRPRR